MYPTATTRTEQFAATYTTMSGSKQTKLRKYDLALHHSESFLPHTWGRIQHDTAFLQRNNLFGLEHWASSLRNSLWRDLCVRMQGPGRSTLDSNKETQHACLYSLSWSWNTFAGNPNTLRRSTTPHEGLVYGALVVLCTSCSPPNRVITRT